MRSIKLGHATITQHAFSHDNSLLAVARGNDAELYFDTGSEYELGTTLQGHDKKVTAVDISSQGLIVTCSQDRNAQVWTAQSDGTWSKTLVLLRINRAATCVRWNASGSKFAVGSGDRVIAVCSYEPENDWWVSKHIKKPLKSTILSVDWHPEGVLLAAGSSDGHARVFSAYIKSVDARPPPGVWGERLPFQTLCGDFSSNSGAYVHDVAFSPLGNALAWVTHDSEVLVAYPAGENQPPQAVYTVDASRFLPFHSLVWTTETQIVAAGYDCHPVVFQGSSSGWEFSHSIDYPKSSSKGREEQEQSALNMFRRLDLKGTVEEASTLATVHQNTIRTVRKFGKGKVSTSGDGQVVIFDV